jgi:hypothetical protein
MRSQSKELSMMKMIQPSLSSGFGTRDQAFTAHKDIKRAPSLLALVREEITKTGSLDCLERMSEREDDVDELLAAIATALKEQLDTSTPLPALELVKEVLVLFEDETYNKGHSDRDTLISNYENYFAICLYKVGVVSPLIKLASDKLMGQCAIMGIFHLARLWRGAFPDSVLSHVHTLAYTCPTLAYTFFKARAVSH